MRRLICAVALACAALGLGGCGEIHNTIEPQPGTADQLTVALDSAPSVAHAGIYAAQQAGYFTQTDLDVTIQQPNGENVLDELYDGKVDAAITTPPALLRARNGYQALVAVAAIVQTPQPTRVTCTRRKTGTGTHARTVTACRGTTPTSPPAPYTRAPSYPALVIAVTKSMIVDNAPTLRRLVQAIARGYELARSDPGFAAQALAAANPSLHVGETTQAIRLSASTFFPPTARPWGWVYNAQWNALGQWMLNQRLITVPNATVDAADNELLAGQGI